MCAKRQQFDQLRCPHHPHADLVEDYRAGDMVCPLCGVVVGDRVVDVGTEWRTFSGDQGLRDRSRVGAAMNHLLDGRELTTVMDTSGSSTNQFASWAMNAAATGSTDRGLLNGMREISSMADRISLPKVIVDQAQALFKQVQEEKLIRGRSYDAVAAACLFIACRQEDVPRSFKEICRISRYTKKEIGRCFKHLTRVLPQFSQPGTKTTTSCHNSPDKFMSRYCSNLELPRSVQKLATHIAQSIQRLDIARGRVYLSIYTAAIFLACLATNEKRTVKEIHEAVGVAEGTIRQTYRIVYPYRKELFPEDYEGMKSVEDIPPL